ncbi:transposase-like protein [Flavobacterium arsenatis]|uniref:Transposase-like protein n=1 Tax=Flavobacterium arsenatis TaxID=1484332 RepID=A0ABU1TJZ3_9FLAO|nr:transposase-like protein [Flavobacterium arsenatis]
MKNKDVESASKRSQKDYSLTFKLQVVDEIEKGYLTYKESQKKYGIQGRSTVLVWLRKHGNLDWKPKSTKKSKQSPKTVISQLEAKIKRLEAEKEILNHVIDIADSTMNAEIRKKYLPLLQKAYKAQRKNPDTPLI